MQKYILKIKDLEIPLEIQNYKTSKGVNIYFRGDTLKITKSPYIAKKEIDKIIRENEEKIYKTYKKILDSNTISKRGIWQNENEILYGGEKYKIKIEYKNDNKFILEIDKQNKEIQVKVPKDMTEEEEIEYIRKTFKNLLKNNTEVIITERLPYWADEMQLKYNSVKVRDAKTKYGSCAPKTKALHFSSRLAMLSKESIDAIIVHELCHLVYPNHSKDFYNLLEKYIPNYKEIDKNLNKTASLINI